jgi:hypothetical protein
MLIRVGNHLPIPIPDLTESIGGLTPHLKA